MISVITPTIRKEGLKLVKKALNRQAFQDFEWIIPTPISFIELDRELDHEEFTYVQDPHKGKDNIWTLNKAYNKAIKQAKGELIVSWQDYTFAKPDALEKFWFHYTQEPKTIVSGVGDKYQDDSWTVKTWQDPRERDDQGTYYQCYFSDIEGNFCSVPRDAFYDVGGFDEWLDKYYGMDFYSVMERLSLKAGWDFKLDQTNKSYSLEHSRPTDWEENNALHGPYNQRRKAYIANPKLDYLR